jgi:hypothetical protein
MWLLIILVVNINNPNDVPGRASIEFPTEQTCEQARATVKYWFKFEGFRAQTQCQKQSSS